MCAIHCESLFELRLKRVAILRARLASILRYPAYPMRIHATRWNLVLSGLILVPGYSRLPLALISPIVGASVSKVAQIVISPAHRVVVPNSKSCFRLFIFSTGKINSLGSRSSAECRLALLLLVDRIRDLFPGIHLSSLRVSNCQLSGQIAQDAYDEKRFLEAYSESLAVRPPTSRFRGTFVYPLKSHRQAVVVLFRTSAFVTVGLKTSRESAIAIVKLVRMLEPYLHFRVKPATTQTQRPLPHSLVARLLHGCELEPQSNPPPAGPAARQSQGRSVGWSAMDDRLALPTAASAEEGFCTDEDQESMDDGPEP